MPAFWKLEGGCEDRYLFVQKSYSGKSLLDVLELNDSMNDIFSNQRLTGILSGIAYNEESMISVSSEGIYQMGVLSGTITGEHVAGFLGARARERKNITFKPYAAALLDDPCNFFILLRPIIQ